MLEVKSTWSGGLISESDESLDQTFRARAEPEQTGIGHAGVRAEVCGVLRSPESGCKKYVILNWLNRTVTVSPS